MIPLRDDEPSRTYPVVNTLVILLNVLVFLYEIGLGDNLEPFINAVALTPARFTHGGDALFPLDGAGWSPVFVSMFLHGGFAHVGGNMLFLWVFGDNVEDRLGHGRYVVFYLASGVLAALTHIYADPLSRVPMVGASGAIAGVLGAWAVTRPGARVRCLVVVLWLLVPVTLSASALLVLWLLL